MTDPDSTHQNDGVRLISELAANNRARRPEGETEQKRLADEKKRLKDDVRRIDDIEASALIGLLAEQYESGDRTVEDLKALINGTPLSTPEIKTEDTDALHARINDLVRDRDAQRDRADEAENRLNIPTPVTIVSRRTSGTPMQAFLEAANNVATPGQVRHFQNVLKKKGTVGAFEIDTDGKPVSIKGYTQEINELRGTPDEKTKTKQQELETALNERDAELRKTNDAFTQLLAAAKPFCKERDSSRALLVSLLNPKKIKTLLATLKQKQVYAVDKAISIKFESAVEAASVFHGKKSPVKPKKAS